MDPATRYTSTGCALARFTSAVRVQALGIPGHSGSRVLTLDAKKSYLAGLLTNDYILVVHFRAGLAPCPKPGDGMPIGNLELSDMSPPDLSIS